MSFEVVERVRSKYPTPLGATHPAFLAELVVALGPDWGLLRKPGGTRINVAGVDVSQDVVCNRAGVQFDVLGDGEGAAVPAWSPVDPTHYTPDPERFFRPDGAVPPVPEPVPPVDDPASEARLRALEESFDRLAGAVKELALLAEQRFQLVGQELDDLDGRLKRPQTVGVRTERRLYHDHDLKLEIPGK